jgi:proteasome lid subunit RPN8/RPN11
LSQDEIIFEELRYREPERRRRPDRDRRWACLAYDVPGPDDLPIFLDLQSADTIERHALRDTSVELGGILLGKECLDEQTGQPFVWVTQSLEAKHFENTQASFTYTHDSWEEITRERDRLFPDLDVVGWYHTHPDFGVFLSSHDQFIHRHFFGQPLQVAYVVDPIRQTRGFFQWRDETLDQVGGYYLWADRGDRLALARLVNDLENIPNVTSTGGGLGGLSPRLEAELIAMLTRPQQAHVTAADRVQSATLFTLLGTLLGVLGLAAVFWLNGLNTRIGELTNRLDESSVAQRLALDTLMADAGKNLPERFAARYAQAVRDLDAVRLKVENQVAINEALAARNKELQGTDAQRKADLEKARKTAKTYEDDAKAAPDLRDQVTALEDKVKDQAEHLARQGEVIDTIEGKKIDALLQKYDRTWYVALAGWVVGALLALGLVAVVAGRHTEPAERKET